MIILNLFEKCFIDKSSPVPIYYQVQNAINRLIETGKLKIGDKLPNETELCKIFNVSRMTIRQAINNLVNSGQLQRKAGKGTFVLGNKIIFDISLLKSFSEDMKSRGFNVANKIISKQILKSDSFFSYIFKIPKNSDIFCVKRLRYINSLPVAIETTHIPVDKCPNIVNADLISNSLFFLLENEYNLKLDYSEQIIEPIEADKETANLLGIKLKTPLLKMTGKTFLKNGDVIEFVIGIYRGDRYKFRLYPKRQNK